MKTKGQFRGHCQVCGRVHVVEDSNNLAKHGYRVAGFGYFAGACAGSGELPLQQERSLCDSIIRDLNRKAHGNEVRAAALRAGGLTPHKAQKLEVWGARVWVWVGEGRNKGRAPVMVSWGDASEAERKMQIELDAGAAESFARFARAHANGMQELARWVHGTKLIDRDREELDRVAAHKAKHAPIEGAYRSKAEQQRALEVLGREYGQARQIITNRYLDDVRREPRSEVNNEYYSVPHELHQWREKHSATVLARYPELNDTINRIRGLVVARIEIKSRPVIK